MTIQEAAGSQRQEIIALLQSQKLPADDLPPSLEGFYIAMENGRLIGLIGLERYGQSGLLRSMVVHPDHRNKKIAGSLVQQLEERAVTAGLQAMYLLTETAENYFGRRGYAKISRDDVPEEVKHSSEFSHVCPVSATVMKKELFKHP